MKIPQLSLCLLVMFLFFSCGYKEQAKVVVQDFFTAVKNEDSERMADLYPEVTNLRSTYKSDTIVIKEIRSIDEDKYQVSLTSKYTNGIGKTKTIDIEVYAEPKEEGSPSKGYIIYDTKGFASSGDDDVYKFAKRKGYVKDTSMTDQQVAGKLAEASAELVELARKFRVYLQENVTITHWEWEKMHYSSMAQGNGVVKNNTDYTIPSLKYIVTFYKSDGSEITQESGYVTYSELAPYRMESFSFMSSYVGDASRANISLTFDPEFLMSVVANGDFE